MDTFGSPTESPRPERVTTGKAKRYLAAAALVTGGLTVGAYFSPIGLADAQSDDTTTGDADSATTDESTDSESSETESDTETETESSETETETERTEDGKRHTHRHGHGDRLGAALDELSAIVGLSEDELRDRLSEGQSLAEIAAEQGVESDELVDALVANLEERLAEAVTDGRIDQGAADERMADAQERIQELIERTPGEGAGFGQGRRGGLHGHHGGALRLGGAEVEELLGLSADDIRGALADGQSLAEIAEAQGVGADELVAAIVAAASERIDSAVADERIDSEKADELKASLEEQITAMVKAEPGERSLRRGFGHRGFENENGADSEVESSSLTA